MTAIFHYILNLSITASFAALAVLIFRLFLKKAPRYITCLLWCLVAIRLLFPFSIQSDFSIIPSQKAEIQAQLEENFAHHSSSDGSFWDQLSPGENKEGDKNEENALSLERKEPTKSLSTIEIISFLWLFGAIAMLLAMGISYFRLKHKMASSIPLSPGVRQSEKASSPFILGILKPVIFLPFGLDEETVASVLLHERSHLKRGDHLIKPFAYLLLSLHWFNPVLWLSYFFLCRDIEAACDEKVLKTMEAEDRKNYARALLNCATRKTNVYACPLAFGELNVKGRIKMTLSYKKPVFWIILLAILFAVLAAVTVLTDPKDKIKETETKTEESLPENESETQDSSFIETVHWDNLNQFNFSSGVNGFLFDSNEKAFEPYKIRYTSENWNEPILAVKSFNQLFYVLDNCTAEKKLSEETKSAVKAYFDQKTEEFLDIYPSATPYDFFQDHTLLLFYTPIKLDSSINRIHLKISEEKLNISLQISTGYVLAGGKEDYSENLGELQFVWIANSAFEKYENGKITCTAKKSYQTDWVFSYNYVWESDPNKSHHSIHLSANRYYEENASCRPDFGNKEYEGYRYRIENYFEIKDDVLIIQRAPVPEILPEQPEKLEYEDAYVFTRKDDALIYDEEASPIKIKGIPNGAEFTVPDPLS